MSRSLLSSRINPFTTAACVGAATLIASGQAVALPIMHELTVQPIQVCYDSGAQCGDLSSLLDGSVESFADQMFGLAGLDVGFLAPLVLDTTSTGDISEHFHRFQLEAALGPISGRTLVSAFFDPAFGQGVDLYGLAWFGAAGLLTGTSFDVGIEVALVFAHELGHNLGLGHYFDFGRGATNNLMDFGACAVGNCSLAQSQITQMQTSFATGAFSFVHAVRPVPEPATWSMLLLGGLVGLRALRGRRVQD